MHLVHGPILKTPDTKEGSNLYDDNLAYMDKQVGEIVAEVEKLGLREKTLIIFSGLIACVAAGQDRKLADGFDPAWSPDGRWLAYATNGQLVERVALAKTAPDRLTRRPSNSTSAASVTFSATGAGFGAGAGAGGGGGGGTTTGFGAGGSQASFGMMSLSHSQIATQSGIRASTLTNLAEGSSATWRADQAERLARLADEVAKQQTAST